MMKRLRRWRRSCLVVLILSAFLCLGLCLALGFLVGRSEAQEVIPPLDVMLLIDHSDSMWDKDGAGSDPAPPPAIAPPSQQHTARREAWPILLIGLIAIGSLSGGGWLLLQRRKRPKLSGRLRVLAAPIERTGRAGDRPAGYPLDHRRSSRETLHTPCRLINTD